MQFHAFSGILLAPRRSKRTQPQEVAQKVSKAKCKGAHVKVAHVVTGRYDVMAYVEFDNLEALKNLLYKIYDTEGVYRTETWIELR